MISTPLQPLLNVDSGKQRFPDGGSSMISDFIELTANSFGRDWTVQMLMQPSSHFGGSNPMLSSHNGCDAGRSLTISLEVRAELLLFLEVFQCFTNSVVVLAMVALEKPSSSTVLVTEAPAI